MIDVNTQGAGRNRAVGSAGLTWDLYAAPSITLWGEWDARGARVKSLVVTSYRASSPGIRTPRLENEQTITLFILGALWPYQRLFGEERLDSFTYILAHIYGL